MRVGLIPVVQLDVVIAAVSLLLHLKGDEAQLNAVALLGGQQPFAVRVTGIVVVSKLGVRVEVLLSDFCLQTTAALCRDEERKSEIFNFILFYSILTDKIRVVQLPSVTTRGGCCL